MTTRHRRILWGTALLAMLAGCLLCSLTGRTAGHMLTIALACTYLPWAIHLADAYLPNRQSCRVHRLSALIFGMAGASLLAFYLWHFSAAKTVFIHDDSLYYYQQLALSGQLQNGLTATLRHFSQSLGTDYPCAPNLLLAPVFSLTDRSISGFGLAAFLMTWPLLLYQLRRIVLVLADRLRLDGNRTLLLCAGLCVSLFTLPLLHRAALWRQPNLLGLPILLQVVFLSWQADFRRMAPLRMGSLFLSVVMLVLMRRWFVFFLAGYLPLWGVLMLLRVIRQKDWRALRNLLLYGVCCIMLGLALLSPLFTRAIAGNYAVAYEPWRKEGSPFVYEVFNQSWLLGWGTCLMIASGYVWSLLQRRSRGVRLLSGVMLSGAAIAVFLFTRIQNMTYHQATLLMPAYVLGLLFFFAMLAGINRRALRMGATLAACMALLTQWGMSITHEAPQRLSPLLSHISLKPPVRDDLEALAAVNDFISETCSADHPALILMNSDEYDRLTFVNLRYPDLSLRDRIAHDRIALTSDGFPRAWFSARYILVPTSPQTGHPGGTVEKLTRHLLVDEADRFEAVDSFPFDSFDLLVMQRKGPVRYDEVEELMALFADEHALYPRVYGDRIGFFYGLTLE